MSSKVGSGFAPGFSIINCTFAPSFSEASQRGPRRTASVSDSSWGEAQGDTKALYESCTFCRAKCQHKLWRCVVFLLRTLQPFKKRKKKVTQRKNKKKSCPVSYT